MLIRTRILSAITGALALLLTASAHAGTPVDMPEPGTWALLGLAAAIGIAVSRKKRK
jgi:PEP-CTERM motif